MYQIKLYTNTIPKSLNVMLRKHWSGRKKEMKQLEDELRLNILRTYNPKERVLLKKVMPLEKVALVELTYYFPDKRKRDLDNFSGKSIFDALKGWAIKDDNSEVVSKVNTEFRCVKGMSGVEVILNYKEVKNEKN